VNGANVTQKVGNPSAVALIPARAGSVRVRNKNAVPLAGHPVLAYTIAAARQSGVFDAVVVSTDSEEYARIARHYGAEVPFMRAAEHAGELSPDIDWVHAALTQLGQAGRQFDCFSILRPTSPFRLPETIRRAFAAFTDNPRADSLRAVEKCKQHPAKMWIVRGTRMVPLLTMGPDDPPWHSTPYQRLPVVYVQNASLEFAWSRVVFEQRTIAGDVVLPFLTQKLEGFDINQPEDMNEARRLAESDPSVLPRVDESPYQST
jgi:CMP-N,N'-diacetyllegionaminic acid synthase